MAARPLPLWYAQPRGTAITSIAALGDDGGDREGLLPQLGHRLVNLVDGGPAAVVGFLVILSMLAALPAAAASVVWLAALLALIPLGWCGLAAAAGLAVYQLGENAPPWARALVTFLVITGKAAVVTFVVTTVIITVAIVFAMIAGISSAGRDR